MRDDADERRCDKRLLAAAVFSFVVAAVLAVA